jgi:hypothetical protein
LPSECLPQSFLAFFEFRVAGFANHYGSISPLGPLVAEASAEGYSLGEGRAPFHGYYYKILTKQGPAAPGGALDYVVNGKMIGGFALAAYPAS